MLDLDHVPHLVISEAKLVAWQTRGAMTPPIFKSQEVAIEYAMQASKDYNSTYHVFVSTRWIATVEPTSGIKVIWRDGASHQCIPNA